MARRTKADAAITRGQVLDAAEQAFREHGVASTTLAEVARAAGVTRGAVYWHFRDKADLLGALCERARPPLEPMLGADGARDALAALRHGAITTLRHLAADSRAQALFALMFQSCGGGDAASLESTRERERGACLIRVEGLVRAAIEAGELPLDSDPALTAHALHAWMLGIMVGWVRHPASFDLDAAAPALVDAMLAGLRAAPLAGGNGRRRKA
jgi:TetR/AcrR family acrAB operon transcriptional repressor